MSLSELDKTIIGTIKEYAFMIGGRGPRNINIKKNGQQFVLELRINKSHLELFILNSFEDSNKYLEDMYNRIADVVTLGIIKKIKAEHLIDVRTVSFEVDIEKDFYRIIFEEFSTSL